MGREVRKYKMNDYDKYHLVPKERSFVSSREEVNMHSMLYGLYPFMSSPMKGVSGSKLVIEMGRNNCLGILHRFEVFSEREKMVRDVAKANVPFGIAIGMGGNQEEFQKELSYAKFAIERGAILICLDVANGYIPQHEDRGKQLREEFPDIALMSGNVVDYSGAEYLYKSGFDFVRVGIGGGSNCSTRAITGVGRNQLEAVQDCSHSGAWVVSDGGITQVGNAVKSFAFGADYCMMGTAFAWSLEAENDGELSGMASLKNHIVNNKTIKSIEGFTTEIDNSKKLPLKEIIDQFIWGTRSACTYLNCKDYKELSSKALKTNQ